MKQISQGTHNLLLMSQEGVAAVIGEIDTLKAKSTDDEKKRIQRQEGQICKGIKSAEKLFLSLAILKCQKSKRKSLLSFPSKYFLEDFFVLQNEGDKIHGEKRCQSIGEEEMWRLLKFCINFIIMCVIILKYPVLL